MKKCIVAACCAAALGAVAETNTVADVSCVTNFGQTVVTATRIETPIEQTGSSIELLSSKQIEQQQSKSVQSALTQVPGVQFAQNGGPGTASSVFMRGANANHTLVLVNGVRVNSNTDGAFNLSMIPTESIERIEVLRGTQSALYGSDAIGGVINIITKKSPDKPLSGSLSTAVGEKGYREQVANLAGNNGVLDFLTTLSYSELNGFDIADNRKNKGSENDPWRRLSSYTDVGATFAEDGRADLTFLYNRNQTELDKTASWPNYWQVDDPDRDSQTEQWLTSFNVSKPITELYSQSLLVSHNKEQTTGNNNGTQEYLFETENIGLTEQSDFQILENDTLSAGYEFRRYDAENKDTFKADPIDQHSAFLSNQLNLYDRLFVTLGGRHDYFSAFDGENTWNAAASWLALDNTRVHSSVGTGYKIPTMNDLFWPNDGWSSGNPDLNPESSRSFDVGVEQTLIESNCVADITYFQSQINDMIIWSETSPWFWQPSNVNQADIKGTELSLTARPVESLTTKAFYTFTVAEDAETGLDLPRRARHKAGTSANWDYSQRGSIYAACNFTGARYDNSANTRDLASFITVDVGTRYRLTKIFSVFANVENLCDTRYETAAGYGVVGRLASAGVKGEF